MRKLLVRALTLTIAVTGLFPTKRADAADHGDAPALAQDLGSDINDVFAFRDPTDNTRVVLIATVHGFLVPGEVPNFAIFDENIRYRFEIYNDHVNLTSPALSTEATRAQKAAYLARVKPNRTIDVTFSRRVVGTETQLNPPGSPRERVPENLRLPSRQAAKIALGGFPKPLGIKSRGVFTKDIAGKDLLVTPFNVGPTAAGFESPSVDVTDSTSVSGAGEIRFFAGEVDDPFFFDLPAFSAFIESVRRGSPSTSPFSRARDTFAGYNTLAIALSVPQELIKGSGNVIGVDFLTQRHVTEINTGNGRRGVGGLKTIDRMGNPGVNVVLIPFDLKNTYNAASAKQDVGLKFNPAITQTLSDLGTSTTLDTFRDVVISKGDLLKLDLNVPNTGTNPEARFPNGRRLQDDTIDILLTLVNNGTTLGDNVNAGSAGPATALSSSFPFLGKPNQPQFSPSPASEDNTRN